ncbi:hypothetical protein STEG23_036435, partial [Scotinomys teguina]
DVDRARQKRSKKTRVCMHCGLSNSGPLTNNLNASLKRMVLCVWTQFSFSSEPTLLHTE